jgi:hypothetical protein
MRIGVYFDLSVRFSYSHSILIPVLHHDAFQYRLTAYT